MAIELPPAIVLLVAGLVVPLVRGRVRQGLMIGACVLTLWSIHSFGPGEHMRLQLWDYQLVLVHIDALGRVFAYAFAVAALVGVVFFLHIDDALEQASALVYASGAVGVVLAGEWVSAYLWWEAMAVASTFLILARRTPQARAAAIRYVLVHVAGGVLLLGGIILYCPAHGFAIAPVRLSGLGPWLMLVGVGVNAAIVPLHAWLPDAYPRASLTGTVFLCVFTTKTAVYMLLRLFAGEGLLVAAGVVMALWAAVYALVQDDLRALLAYGVVSQVGFMVAGAGLGTSQSISGAAAHAVCHIMYDLVLFMAAGAMAMATGTTRISRLRGLWRDFRWGAVVYLVGAGSIGGVIGLCGYTSKSIIVAAMGEAGVGWAWAGLEVAAAGALVAAGFKVVAESFGEGREHTVRFLPGNTWVGMWIGAGICVVLGLWPQVLYRLLPYPVAWNPWDGHNLLHSGLFSLGVLGASWACWRTRLWPRAREGIVLDTDWFWRMAGRGVMLASDRVLNGLNRLAEELVVGRLVPAVARGVVRAPVALAGWVLAPGRREKREEIARAMEAGAVPVGIAIGVAIAMVLVLFVLR